MKISLCHAGCHKIAYMQYVSKSVYFYVFFNVFLYCLCLFLFVQNLSGMIKIKQESQLMLANLCDTFRDLSRSPNIVPFHMLGIASYCAIVTLSLTRAVFTMLNFKECHDLEMVSKITQRQLILLSTGMYPTSVLPVSISYASFAESGSHSIPGQQQHSSTLS